MVFDQPRGEGTSRSRGRAELAHFHVAWKESRAAANEMGIVTHPDHEGMGRRLLRQRGVKMNESVRHPLYPITPTRHLLVLIS